MLKNIQKPVFKSHHHVSVIPGEGVLLLSENGVSALHGRVYELMAPLLDGSRDADAIADALDGQIEGAEVYYSLALLEQKGYLTENAPDISKQISAFWHGLGLEPNEALARLRETPVRIYSLGRLDAAPIHQALKDLGATFCNDDSAKFEVAITDDYLRSGLDKINKAALEAQRPWLLIKPLGHELWIGPLFLPGVTGCHRCLAGRLSRNRSVHRFAAQRGKASGTPITARAATPASYITACQMAALETVKYICGVKKGLAGNVLSLDTRNGTTARHQLLRHPACPDCGQSPEPKASPVKLAHRKVTFTRDGGHRTTEPEQTIKRFEHLVSPITGVVEILSPAASSDGFVHVYVAGHNPALEMRNLDFLKSSLRNDSAGKGVYDSQAKASALCEAIERYSGERTGGEVVETASYEKMKENYGDDVIHPNRVMNFSQKQLDERKEWNAKKSKFNLVPQPMDEKVDLDWTPVWSLTHNRHKYLPTQLLYYQSMAGPNRNVKYSLPCSNGNASGNNLEEAVLQGFCELLERDAVALWWYNRLGKPGVDLKSFDEPYLMQLLSYYRRMGREAWALDLTSDLGVPAFVALSRLVGQKEEHILFGLGCHLDPRIALQRAFAEMNQMLGLAARKKDGQLLLEDEETLTWLTTATLANQPYLVPDSSQPPKRMEDFPAKYTGDLLKDIGVCRGIVEEQGMEVLVLDQTRPDVQMAVAKVIVPGLRHFWARYGPGRLYEAPVKMGWLEKPLSEEELNPIPIFI
jgi:bacteriocin biosynthesis cyclodehydratase domain-containing protein